MKILHLTRQYLPGRGGIESYIQALVKLTPATEGVSRVVTLRRVVGMAPDKLPVCESIDGTTVYRLNYTGPGRYAVAFGLLDHLRWADIIHVHSADALLDQTALLQPLHGRPFVVSTHGGIFHTQFASYLKRAYFHSCTRFNAERAAIILCDSYSDFETFLPIVATGKLRVVEDGVDLEFAVGVADEDKDKLLIACVGRLYYSKRLSRLVDFMASLYKRGAAHRLVILGSDWGEAVKLRAQITALGLEAKVEVVTDATDTAKWTLLKRAGYWVSASEYEGFGIALIEAMACGCLPLVQTNESFERILCNLCDCLVDFRDLRPVGEKLIYFDKMTPSARQTLRLLMAARASDYSWNKVLPKVMEIYRTVRETKHRAIL